MISGSPPCNTKGAGRKPGLVRRVMPWPSMVNRNFTLYSGRSSSLKLMMTCSAGLSDEAYSAKYNEYGGVRVVVIWTGKSWATAGVDNWQSAIDRSKKYDFRFTMYDLWFAIFDFRFKIDLNFIGHGGASREVLALMRWKFVETIAIKFFSNKYLQASWHRSLEWNLINQWSCRT